MRALYEGVPEARQHLVTLLQDYYRQAVGPYWEEMHSHLRVDRAMRRRLMTEGGVERLLATLHHTIRWRPPVLEVMRPPALGASTIYLDGRSLTLAPSIFCSPYPMLFLSTDDDTSPAVLFYPTLKEAHDTAAIWASGGSRRPALEALLGRTRALALEVTADPCTTTELARRLGVAPSTASHHTSVLRAAGLIDSRRYGGAVLHHITGQGRLLLEGRRQRDG
jgi:DNA-binding transcriptional ArsR family regulator